MLFNSFIKIDQILISLICWIFSCTDGFICIVRIIIIMNWHFYYELGFTSATGVILLLGIRRAYEKC